MGATRKKQAGRKKTLLVGLITLIVVAVVGCVGFGLAVKGARDDASNTGDAGAGSTSASASSTQFDNQLQDTLRATDGADGTGTGTDADNAIVLSFTGDCILGTDENFAYSTGFDGVYDSVGDPSYFFRNFADIFASDDLTVVDIECTFTESTAREDKEFAFKAPASYAQILKVGNVEAGTLANNHSQDYGWQSYTDTIECVEALGIKTFGYDRVATVDVKGVTVALIGYNGLSGAQYDIDQMHENIAAARAAGAQVVIVCAHWGVEKEYNPTAAQVSVGRGAIDAGADLVVGCHPHVLSGYECYNGKYIYYSLGNFCFGGNTHPYDFDCFVLQTAITVEDGAVSTVEPTIIPASVSSVSDINNYQPTPLTGSDAERVLAKIEESCDWIAANF